MTELLRKSYYAPRVLLDVDAILQNDWDSWIGCLSGAELSILRTLLQYAHRRINWVKTYYETHYDMPDDTDWDEIETVVSGLEENLMDCSDYTDMLETILDNQIAQIGVGGPLRDGDDGFGAFPIDDEMRDDLLEPDTEDACAIAQLWYQGGFEAITEKVLPATGFVFDYLLPALGTLIVGALEPTPIPELIGIYVISEGIQECMQAGYDSSETNLYNWLISNKDELICTLYDGCKAHGNASDIWSDTYDAVVSPSEGISLGDKLMINLFFGSWMGLVAALAWENSTDWALDNVDEDYCDDCPEPEPDMFWSGSPYATADFSGGYNYDDARSLDVATTITGTVMGNLEVGDYDLDVYASGYNGYGGSFNVYIKQSTYTIDSVVMAVTSSSETQHLEDVITITEGHTDNIYVQCSAIGGCVARILSVALTKK